MWRKITVLFLAHHLLTILGQVIDDCQLPTLDNPLSMCAYCSDSHAGIKWVVHKINPYPTGVYSIKVRFQCRNSENTTTQDKCFDGSLFPGITFIPSATVWNWHMLGTNFSEGTECVFTATLEDGYSKLINELTSACTINGSSRFNREVIVPATCLDSDENSCSCHCREGFVNFKIVEDDYGTLFTCRNRNECLDGTHSCINESGCIDSEGSYTCNDEPTPTRSYRSTATAAPFEIDTTELEVGTTATATANETPSDKVTKTAIHTSGYTVGSIIVITFVIIIFVTIVTLSAVILCSLMRKKRYMRNNRKMITIPSQFTNDDFDPNFRPVDIDKLGSPHLVATVSVHSVIDQLYRSNKMNTFPSSDSFGSIISLNYLD